MIPYDDEVDLGQSPERTVVDLAALGLEPLRVLGSYRYRHAHAPRPPSRHRTLVVLAVPVRGSFAFDVDGSIHEVQPGELVRIPPGRTYTTGLTAEPRGALLWLIAQVTDQPTSTARAVRLLANPDGALTATGAEEVRGPLDRALALAGATRDWIDDALLATAVATGVLAAARALGEQAPPAWPHQGVARVLAWLEEHLAEPVTATDLAALAGLSTTQFYAAFRAATGTSPKDHLLRRRTECAREWLRRDPGVKITTVAHALGFATPQSFATVFRRYCGTSPSSWRST